MKLLINFDQSPGVGKQVSIISGYFYAQKTKLEGQN